MILLTCLGLYFLDTFSISVSSEVARLLGTALQTLHDQHLKKLDLSFEFKAKMKTMSEKVMSKYF